MIKPTKHEEHLAWDFAETYNLSGTEAEEELAILLAMYREEIINECQGCKVHQNGDKL
jgi:hypothetical protein